MKIVLCYSLVRELRDSRSDPWAVRLGLELEAS